MIDGLGANTSIVPQTASAGRVAAKQAPLAERPVDLSQAVQTAQVQPPPIQPGQLQLDIDRSTGRVVGRIIDKQSGATIKQIPSEEALRLIAISQQLLGAFIDRKL